MSTGRGGRAKKKVGKEIGQWDWDGQREKLLRSVGVSAGIDLWKLFRPKNPDARLLQKWLKLVFLQSALKACTSCRAASLS